MTLTQKLILYALVVALIPVAVTGVTLIRASETALAERILAHQRTAASAVGATVAQSFDELGERLSIALSLADPVTLRKRERAGFLRLLHRQSSATRVAILVDADGEFLSEPLALAEAAPETGSAGPPTLVGDLAQAAGKALLTHLPSLASFGDRTGHALLSPAYFPGPGPARIAMAAACCADPAGHPRAMAGIEVALGRDTLVVDGIDTGAGSRLFLVDSRGRVIAHGSQAVGTDLSADPLVAAFLRDRTATSLRYVRDGRPWVSSIAPAGALGWGVVVEQPEELAFAEAARMRTRTLTWILVTTLVVLATALLFAGRVRRRLLALVGVARAFGSRRLDERAVESPSDEIGELGSTFNGMAMELSRSLRELEEWSRTLEAKVDERTRELRQTQAQLLTHSKLAAIGQLGAGVAHEINNPLASILGYAQLLLKRHAAEDADVSALRRIEEAAQRCKSVTMNLLRFSQRSLGGRVATEINKAVDEVLELVGGGLEHAGITVERAFSRAPLEIVVDPGQIALVLINLISNAKNAMAAGGRLTLTTSPTDSGVRIDVCDTGHGIPPEHLPRLCEPFFTTKKVWQGTGLGLAVVYRIVADHGGRIEVKSTVGEGSCFTILLPCQPPESTEAAVGPKTPASLLV